MQHCGCRVAGAVRKDVVPEGEEKINKLTKRGNTDERRVTAKDGDAGRAREVKEEA